MLLVKAVGLMVAVRKRLGWHVEHNCAAGCDEVCGGVWGWGRVAGVPPRLPCIGKGEVDGGATCAIKFSGPVAYKGVKPCGRRIGAANTRIVKTIRRYEQVVHVETVFGPGCSPIYLEVVFGTGGIGVGPAMDFKTVRDTVRIVELRIVDSTGALKHASTTGHSAGLPG